MVWTGCLQIVLDKGQEDDWFGAVWVRWAVAALVVALVGWIWRSWTNPKGLVDLHILKNRNFRTGCFLIALLGMCIYITIAILPLYYQEVLGYTAFTAGLVVGPRGIGSFLGSPVVGFSPRGSTNASCSCAGFIGFGVCALIFGRSILTLVPTTLLIPIIAYRLCAQLCFCTAGDDEHFHAPAAGDGQRYGAFQHAAQHRRVDRDRDGDDRFDSAGCLHQTEIGRELRPPYVLQQKSGGGCRLPCPSYGSGAAPGPALSA